MKTFNLLIAFLLTMAVGNAQEKAIVKYANTITKEDAFKRLSILASDEFAGRGTGQPGAKKAAVYIKSQFESFGLVAPVNNSYFQLLDLKEITPKHRKIKINGKPQVFLKDFHALPNLPENVKLSFQDFVFVGYGITDKNYDDLSSLNLEGKVAVVLAGEPKVNGKSLITGTSKLSDWSGYSSKKIDAIKAKKPVAIVFLDSSVGEMNSSYLNKPKLVLGKADAVQSPLIIEGSASFLNSLLANTGKSVEQLTKEINAKEKAVSFEFKAKLELDFEVDTRDLNAKNVLGFLEGNDPVLKKEIVVITAHYDHLGMNADGEVFNGADDDGSGTTAVLELAEAFSKAKKQGYGPKRSILFMTVVGEEKGLLGSEWYADHPVFPLENTITNLNIDMIGRVGELYKGKADSANYIYVIGSDKLSTTLRKISESTNKTYSNLILDYKYDDPKDPMRIYYRSDHYNFAKHNIPIIFYFNGIHEDYHKKTDDIEKINFPLLVKRAQLVFYTAWELTNRATKPEVD